MTDPVQHPSRRILVITASVGSGHNQAAKAIIETLAQIAPQVQVDLIDTMDLVPRFFRMYYSGGFAVAMTKLPRAYGAGFWFNNRPHTPQRSLSERIRLGLERHCLDRIRQHILANPPDLIVNTHFLAPPMIARLIWSGQIRCPQVIVATDVDLHRWWYSENVEHWFLPSEFSTRRPRQWGIDPSRLTVSGIPIRPKWNQPFEGLDLHSEWNLPRDKRIVLLSGGTEFTVGPVVQIARGIVDACPQAFVVVLAGRNKKLLAQLVSPPHPSGRLMGMGYTDRMPELASLASLMVTKAGGVTTAECLSKALPMVFLKPVPGQEGANAQYFAREGAGVVTQNAPDVIQCVSRLLDNPPELQRLSQNARRLFRPGAQIIAQSICEMLNLEQ